MEVTELNFKDKIDDSEFVKNKDGFTEIKMQAN